MDSFIESLKSMPPWVFWVAGILVVYFIVCFFFIHKGKVKRETFRKEHPEAASVYAQFALRGVKSVQITILQVDGAPYKEHYQEGTKQVYFLLPGKHILDVEADTQRPGVIYRNVRETFGPVKIEVEVEERKKYTVGFDTKEKEFTFTEMN